MNCHYGKKGELGGRVHTLEKTNEKMQRIIEAQQVKVDNMENWVRNYNI